MKLKLKLKSQSKKSKMLGRRHQRVGGKVQVLKKQERKERRRASEWMWSKERTTDKLQE